MKSLLNKGITTIKYDGFLVFLLRVSNFSKVILKRLLRKKDVENIEKWKLLHNKYAGKRIFIVGNGPSLNKTPLYLLKNEYTMCFNRFNLMLERLDWVPNFYAVTDDLVIKDMNNEINTQILPIVEKAFFPDIHPSNLDVKDYITNAANVYWLNTDTPSFSDQMPYCGINKTVVNAGIQVAAYLGFKDIYLIGVDVTFTDQKVKKINSRNWEADEKDPNHFDPRYFEKGRKYHNPTVHEMVEKFEEAREFFDKRNVHIYNAGIGGKLEAFPRVDYNSLFNYTDEQTQDLLMTARLKQKGLTFADLQSSPEVKYENQKEFPAIFKTSIEDGAILIPKLIETYIPVGQYAGHHYFVKK